MAYRHSAETFVNELTAEYYRHYAGLKDSYEIEPIYERHASLFGAAPVADLRGRVDAAPGGSEEHRRLTMLLDFAIEGYIGEATKHAEAELARLEASISISSSRTSGSRTRQSAARRLLGAARLGAAPSRIAESILP